MGCFNPHTHTGCDHLVVQGLWHLDSFNPHTHTGCDRDWATWRCETWVSIHTPIQGVTHDYLRWLLSSSVSIHTPIQGVTIYPGKFRVIHWVSIHTPIQGVTSSLNNGISSGMFQSTHPYRVWRKHRGFLKPYHCFNPHTHTGCDGFWLQTILQPWCFNPHTHTGCDERFAR